MYIVDFAIICALEEERQAILEQFPEAQPSHTKDWKRWFALIENGGKVYRLVILEVGAVGNLESQRACQDLITQLSPHMVFLVGICGGILSSASNYRLGDVVVSTEVIYYEQAKHWPREMEPRERIFSISIPEKFAVFMEGAKGWRDEVKVKRPDDPNKRVIAHTKHGKILSGEKVIASSAKAEQLRERYPEAISIEMESAGVANACAAERTVFLVVKAVSDTADDAKSEGYRSYAAATAAAFVSTVLRKGDLPDLPVRNLPIKLSNELLGIVQAGETVVVLPGRRTKQARDKPWDNYPPSEYDIDYDDMLSIFRLAPAISVAARNYRISYIYDLAADAHVHTSQAKNVVYIGSTVSNQLTRAQLKNAFFYFTDNRTIVNQSKTIECHADTRPSRLDQCTLVRDYALISAFHEKDQTKVVIGGCRAYGQLLTGDFLADSAQLEQLLRLVGHEDFQCVICAEIAGHSLVEYFVEHLVVRRGRQSKWQEIKIDEPYRTQV